MNVLVVVVVRCPLPAKLGEDLLGRDRVPLYPAVEAAHGQFDELAEECACPLTEVNVEKPRPQLVDADIRSVSAELSQRVSVADVLEVDEPDRVEVAHGLKQGG